MTAPYKAVEKSSYWQLIDTRTGEPASYPTSKRNCMAEAKFMNRNYAELMAEAQHDPR